MASIFKPRGKTKYVILYTDASGRRRKKTGATDKTVTQRIARDLENRVALRREGLIDPADETNAHHQSRPLCDYLNDFEANLRARDNTAHHAKLHSDRARRVASLVCGGRLADFDPPKTAGKLDRARANARRAEILRRGRLADLTLSKVQDALGARRAAGHSLQTLNHHRAAIRGFVLWARKDGRLRDDPLLGLSGFNPKEDRRHDRRTLAVDELRRLIQAAEAAPLYREMTGPARALVYRLAVASGLRYAEIASITPESFDLAGDHPFVTVLACYAKNGQTATLPLPRDVAADLGPFVRGLPTSRPVFSLPHGEGAAMLRKDLDRAGIAYRDEAGRVFDFHALRCQCATLADQVGVSPRVVQRLMRHSSLDMTNRYTRPRAVDIENAAAALPSLRPHGVGREVGTVAATGTDGSARDATRNATAAEEDDPNPLINKMIASNGDRYVNPLVVGSSPTPVTPDRNRQDPPRAVLNPRHPGVYNPSSSEGLNSQSRQDTSDSAPKRPLRWANGGQGVR
jgi:integrase